MILFNILNRFFWILLEAVFEMNSKDPKEILAILDKRKEKRMSTQPWNFPSAGSVQYNTYRLQHSYKHLHLHYQEYLQQTQNQIIQF